MSLSPLPGADVATELGGPDRPLQMDEIAGVIGSLRDVEMALFSWLGRRASSLSSAGDIVWASGASLRAAWRSAQLQQLLGVSVGLPSPAGATTTPGSATAMALGALGAFVAPDEQARPSADPDGAPAGEPAHASGDVPGIASAWYAALLAAYLGRLGRLSTAADGALERVLQRVLADLEEERALVQGLRQRPGRGA